MLRTDETTVELLDKIMLAVDIAKREENSKRQSKDATPSPSERSWAVNREREEGLAPGLSWDTVPPGDAQQRVRGHLSARLCLLKPEASASREPEQAGLGSGKAEGSLWPGASTPSRSQASEAAYLPPMRA